MSRSTDTKDIDKKSRMRWGIRALFLAGIVAAYGAPFILLEIAERLREDRGGLQDLQIAAVKKQDFERSDQLQPQVDHLSDHAEALTVLADNLLLLGPALFLGIFLAAASTMERRQGNLVRGLATGLAVLMYVALMLQIPGSFVAAAAALIGVVFCVIPAFLTLPIQDGVVSSGALHTPSTTSSGPENRTVTDGVQSAPPDGVHSVSAAAGPSATPVHSEGIENMTVTDTVDSIPGRPIPVPAVNGTSSSAAAAPPSANHTPRPTASETLTSALAVFGFTTLVLDLLNLLQTLWRRRKYRSGSK